MLAWRKAREEAEDSELEEGTPIAAAFPWLMIGLAAVFLLLIALPPFFGIVH
jgi:hypothetical protein